jgi:hypothetical protein
LASPVRASVAAQTRSALITGDAALVTAQITLLAWLGALPHG